jgi:hypothetical protein
MIGGLLIAVARTVIAMVNGAGHIFPWQKGVEFAKSIETGDLSMRPLMWISTTNRISDNALQAHCATES